MPLVPAGTYDSEHVSLASRAVRSDCKRLSASNALQAEEGEMKCPDFLHDRPLWPVKRPFAPDRTGTLYRNLHLPDSAGASLPQVTARRSFSVRRSASQSRVDMALAASLGRLLQSSSARLRHAAPVLAAGIQRTAISSACSPRQAAVPEPISEEAFQPEPAAAGPPNADWTKNLGAVRNDWT